MGAAEREKGYMPMPKSASLSLLIVHNKKKKFLISRNLQAIRIQINLDA